MKCQIKGPELRRGERIEKGLVKRGEKKGRRSSETIDKIDTEKKGRESIDKRDPRSRD